jgi:hypothetical protein
MNGTFRGSDGNWAICGAVFSAGTEISGAMFSPTFSCCSPLGMLKRGKSLLELGSLGSIALRLASGASEIRSLLGRSAKTCRRGFANFSFGVGKVEPRREISGFDGAIVEGISKAGGGRAGIALSATMGEVDTRTFSLAR